jgi:hypothetical protein
MSQECAAVKLSTSVASALSTYGSESGVVFGDTSDALPLIPEGRPRRMLLAEAAELRDRTGHGEIGHGFLPRSECATR